jgi:double zinc ribbon protein
VTDLERFFAQLVRNIAAGDRARLAKPLLLVDIRNSILPYRANRRALQLESSEDYELVLMRLCAGEGGFARTGPDEVRDEFVKELGSPNPDLTIIQQHEAAVVHLDPKAVAQALDSKPDLAYAPREPVLDARADVPSPSQIPTPKVRTRTPPKGAPPANQPESSPSRCSRCGGGLPVGRVVNFCPQCGQNLARTSCPACKTELEPTWRHCVNCGAALNVGP